MHQDNPLITFEREEPHITVWTSTSSSPVVSEDPKEDHGYGYLTAPLRQRGLEVTVEYGLSDYSVPSLLAAVDTRLDQLGVPPRSKQQRSSQEHAPDTVLRRAGFIAAVSFDGERYHQLPTAMTDPTEQRRAVTRAFTTLQAGGFTVLCDSDLLTSKGRSAMDRTALPTSAQPRVSAALAPSPSAGPRTVRTRLATDPPPRPVLPLARPSTTPGR